MTRPYRNLVAVPTSPLHAFRHYFIPHEGNDHRPLSVRPKALKIYSVLLIGLKLFITVFLYSTYPTIAQFSELTSETIFRLTNGARTTNGAAGLALNGKLSRAAKAKAEDMLQDGYFDHTGPDGKKFWQWIRETGYTYTTAGENLAMDFSSAESAQNALLGSPSHRANILRAAYRDIGIGVAHGVLNGRSTTVLVELFATPQTPSTTPTVASATTTRSTYQTSVVGKSDERFVLLPGSELRLWIDFKNEGTAVWKNTGANFVALNLTNPPGRESVFRHPAWTLPYRPGILDSASVRPGDIGRVSFLLRAPSAPGEFTESFGLVAENLEWIDGGNVTIPLTVIEPTPTQTTSTPQDRVRQAFTTTSVMDATPEEPEPTLRPSEPSALPVTTAVVKTPDWRSALVAWTTKIFWAVLIFIAASLALTIVIRIRVQHSTLIAQTLLVLILAVGATFLKTHFAETTSQPIVISVHAASFSIVPSSEPVEIPLNTDFQFHVDPASPITWEVQGDIGSITKDGIFTAQAAGSGRIKATGENETTDVKVRVVGNDVLVAARQTSPACTTLRSWVWVSILFVYVLACILTAAGADRPANRWVWPIIFTVGILTLYGTTRCAGLHAWLPYAIGVTAIGIGLFINRVFRQAPFEQPH